MVLRINLFQIPFLFFPTTNQIGERPNFFDPGTIHQTPSSDPVSYFLNLSKKKFLMILIISKNICQTFSEVFECLWKYLYDHIRCFWIFLEIFVRPFLTFLNISEWFSFSWKKFLLSPETFPRTFLNPGLFDVTGLCTNRAIKQHLLSSGRINRISPVKGVQVVSAIKFYTVLSSKNFGLKWILSEMSIWHEKTFDVILRN